MSGSEVSESYRTQRPTLATEDEIALTILADLLDRRGYRQEFEGFEEDVQNEILFDWIELIDTNQTPSITAQNILNDVKQRSGWDDIYDSVDEDIMEEMIKTWENKIENLMKQLS